MEEKLKELADRFAELKGTQVDASRFIESDNSLSFVLGSGQKLVMTEKELRSEITRLEPKPMRTKPIPEKEDDAVANRKAKAGIATTKEN